MCDKETKRKEKEHRCRVKAVHYWWASCSGCIPFCSIFTTSAHMVSSPRSILTRSGGSRHDPTDSTAPSATAMPAIGTAGTVCAALAVRIECQAIVDVGVWLAFPRFAEGTTGVVITNSRRFCLAPDSALRSEAAGPSSLGHYVRRVQKYGSSKFSASRPIRKLNTPIAFFIFSYIDIILILSFR